MVFIGLILTAAAVTASVGIVMANDQAAALTAFGQSVPLVSNQWQVFIAGAVVAVVFMFGMMFVFMGLGRRARDRREMRYLREEHEESMTTLEMEKRRLQRELDLARQSGPGPGPGPGPGRPVAGPAAPMASASRSGFFDQG